ncbi:MAG: HAD hydrolase-like protein, partial [Rhodospirillales bacterium]
EMLLNAMAETSAKPSSTAMIGDTTYDMEMARNAGTLAVGVSWGYHGVAELKDAGADAVIDAFEELPRTVQALLESK